MSAELHVEINFFKAEVTLKLLYSWQEISLRVSFPLINVDIHQANIYNILLGSSSHFKIAFGLSFPLRFPRIAFVIIEKLEKESERFQIVWIKGISTFALCMYILFHFISFVCAIHKTYGAEQRVSGVFYTKRQNSRRQ